MIPTLYYLLLYLPSGNELLLNNYQKTFAVCLVCSCKWYWKKNHTSKIQVHLKSLISYFYLLFWDKKKRSYWYSVNDLSNLFRESKKRYYTTPITCPYISNNWIFAIPFIFTNISVNDSVSFWTVIKTNSKVFAFCRISKNIPKFLDNFKHLWTDVSSRMSRFYNSKSGNQLLVLVYVCDLRATKRHKQHYNNCHV